jgi:hypothetical protein
VGQYKVPQNVEAEDKILGPLTFRQFIYGLIGAGWALVCFAIFNKIPVVMIVLGFPPTTLFLLLAFYTRDGQNFEQLLLAMIGYFASPHKRLWVKEDVAETFHVEPTKHAAEVTQRNPAEVLSELEKVANLIDSRGWNRPAEAEGANLIRPAIPHEDRIVPVPVPHAPDEPKHDMLDLQKSPLAQNLAQLLAEAAEDVREEALQQMNQHPGRRAVPAALTVAQANAQGLQLAGAGAAAGVPGVTVPSTSDILKLATQSDELTVSQIAAQATRMAPQAAAMQGPSQVIQPANPGQVVENSSNAG